MSSPAELLASLPEKTRNRELAKLNAETKAALLYHWPFHARPDQLPPAGDWAIWLPLAGRGWGKTRVGGEATRAAVIPPGSTPLSARGVSRIALVAETAADARDVMVEGESGLLAIHPPEMRPTYEPSKRRLTWPNGARATLFNATEPDQLRGPQHDFAWTDELAKWRYAQETYDQLQFGLRLGRMPRQIHTTTPRPIPIIRELIERAKADPAVIVTRGRTLDNASNLAKPFLDQIVQRYAGTRLGRQELDAEVLDDLPGALWSRGNLDANRRREAPKLKRIVVAIDPAVTSRETSEDPGTHGINVAGLGEDGRGYILADASLQGTPLEWARRAVTAYGDFGADVVVAEVNQGGEMVKQTLRSVAPGLPIKMVKATRGKHVRAEPVAALYEQGRISHIGSLPDLEDQLCLFTTAGYEGIGSPDRADALVWALTELFAGIIYHAEPEKDALPARRRDYGHDDDEVTGSWKTL